MEGKGGQSRADRRVDFGQPAGPIPGNRRLVGTVPTLKEFAEPSEGWKGESLVGVLVANDGS